MENKEQLKHDISRKIKRNTVFNILGGGWSTVILLILTPYIIGHIGVERYGIWAIVKVFTGYLGLLDFGIGLSFIKHTSAFYMKKDYKSLNHAINTSFVVCTILAVLIVLLGFFALKPLITIFNITDELYQEAFLVLFLGIVLFGISNVLNIFRSIQIGLQRMDMTNGVKVVSAVLRLIGTFYFLKNGYGLPGLIINEIVIFVIAGVIDIFIVVRILPEFRFNPFLFDISTFRKLIGFGFKMQVTKIASLVHFQMDKFLLAYFLQIHFVTYYEVAANLTLKIREFPLVLLSAIFPAVSGLNADTDKELLCKIYRRSMKYLVVVGLPLVSMAIVLAKPFMILWLGPMYTRSAIVMQILLVGYIFNILTGPGFHILNGIGKPEYAARTSALAILLNIFVSVILVLTIGFYGVVIGSAFSMITAALIFISAFHRAVDLPILETLYKIVLKPLIACSIPFSLIIVLCAMIEPVSWFGLIGLAVLFGIIFLCLILVLRYLDDFDMQFFRSILNISFASGNQKEN